MNKLTSYAKQVVPYVIFMLFIAYFSQAPEWRHTEPDQATVKVSVRHPGKLVGECRTLSTEEQKNLAANMKVTTSCPRERSPVSLRIQMDNEVVYQTVAPPSGFQKDGLSTFYERFDVPAGGYLVTAELQDDVNNPEQRYRVEKYLEINPRQILVIDFKDGFLFR